MKPEKEVNTEGVDFCGPTKTSNKGFLMATFEKITKEWLGGYHIIMKNTPRFSCDRTLMAIGYKYIYQKVILLSGPEILNQVLPIYLVSLNIILMFLFSLLFFLM